MLDAKFKGWQHSPELDVSFAHCGVPAYWENDEVYCSKCQEQLTDDIIIDWMLSSRGKEKN